MRHTKNGRRSIASLIGMVLITSSIGAEKKEDAPAGGREFYFHSNLPKFVNCDAEFRDPTGERWPNFFYGRPVEGGRFSSDSLHPKANYSILLDQMCQPRGDQSRKVLADVTTDGKFPTITLTISSIGPAEESAVLPDDAKGKKASKPSEFSPVAGTLAIGSRQVSVKGRAKFHWQYDKNRDGGPSGVLISTTFSLTGKELGLSSVSGKLIEVRITANATTVASAPVPKPKKGK